MSILEEFEKDKVWDHMDDMKILGMTREDLDDDDGIMQEIMNSEETKKEK